jgi:hypothetical protein
MSKGNNNKRKSELDRAGRMVLLAASGNDEETEAAAAAPFLYTRVRAAIAAEERRREEAGGWLSLLFVARRAVPAMALIALLAAVLTFWSARTTTPTAMVGIGEEALFDTRDTGVVQTIIADRNGLSRDEVLSIIVASGRSGK